MELVLGILLAFAALAALMLGLQVGGARAASNKAVADLDALKKEVGELREQAKKATEGLDSKRKEADELKERLRDVKKRRHEEKEAAKLKSDIEQARAEIEREMEHKLALAREEAEVAKSSLRKLSAEVEALKSRKPMREEKPSEEPKAVEAKPVHHEPRPPREATPEEVLRAQEAEKAAARANAKVREMEEEVRRFKGRAETDRRVYVVQKGELDVFKDKFRGLEAKYNALTLERDELGKRLFQLEMQMKSLSPTAEPAKSDEKKGEEAKA